MNDTRDVGFGALTRRQFAQTVVAAIAALAASACHRSPDGKAGHAEAPGVDVTLWDCVRDALRSLEESPDHLAAQSKRVVATGDPARIAAWVRDTITVLPAVIGGSPATASLWGPRATMRSGAGSARDRADLLAGLLAAAGYKTGIVSWKRPTSLTREELYRTHELPFSPNMHHLAPLLERAKRSSQIQVGPDQDTANECRRLTEQLLASVDDHMLEHARPADTALPDVLPIVEYERDGKKGWAIAHGSLDVAASAPDGLIGPSGDTDAHKVKLSVSLAVNPPPNSTLDRTRPHEVLSAQWPVDLIAGRQVLLGFVPPRDPRPYLRGVNPKSELQRIAVARLLSTEPLQSSGTPVMIQGQRLNLAGDIGNRPAAGASGTTAVAPGSAPASALELRKTVTAIELRTSAAAYPTVTLDLSLLDARGQTVSGLGESDFEITEDGKAQTVGVIRNTVPAGIRVLVLYDTSGSVAQSWGTVARRAAFEARLSDQLAAVAKNRPYDLQVVGLSDAPTVSGWAAPNAEQLRSRLSGIGSGSDVWSALGQTAPQSGASAVIVISDFSSTGEDAQRIPGYQRNLKGSAVPLAIVPIGRVDRAATGLIHKLSGCEEIAQNDPKVAEKISHFVDEQLSKAAIVNYQLQYRAPENGPAKRKIEVTVKDARAPAARAEYSVPPSSERVAQTGIAGVYLTIEVAGRSATRTLAGLPLSNQGTVADTANQSAIDEATLSLNGLHTIAFEPAEPTASATLYDGLARMLTLEPIFKAADRPAFELLPQLARVQRFEPTPGLLLEPLPDVSEDLGGAVPDGLRVMVISETNRGKDVWRSVDLLSEFNTWRGLNADPKKAFRAAFRRSLASSVREGKLFAQSAARDLSVGPWVALPLYDDGAKMDSVSAASKDWLRAYADRYGSSLRLVRQHQAVGGAWIIDPSSGSVTAVDASGRGGAGCSIPDDFGLTVALALLSATCLVMDAGPGSTGFLACVGADTYSAAATAAASFQVGADVNGAAYAALMYGIQLAGLMALPGPAHALGRGILGVVLAMLAVLTAACPGSSIIQN